MVPALRALVPIRKLVFIFDVDTIGADKVAAISLLSCGILPVLARSSDGMSLMPGRCLCVYPCVGVFIYLTETL